MPELCNICAKPTTRFCTGCEKAHYCSVECQRQDWPTHREECDIGLRFPFSKSKRIELYAGALKMFGEHYFAEYTRWLNTARTGDYMPTREIDVDLRNILLRAVSSKYRWTVINQFAALWRALVEHIFCAIEEKAAYEAQMEHISKMLVSIWLKESGFTFRKETADRKESRIAAEWKMFLDTLLNYGSADSRRRDAIEERNGQLALKTAETIVTGD